jgi:hypothetical protein
LFANVAANLAELDLFTHLGEHLGETRDVKRFGLKNVKSDSLGRLRADAR